MCTAVVDERDDDRSKFFNSFPDICFNITNNSLGIFMTIMALFRNFQHYGFISEFPTLWLYFGISKFHIELF